MAVVGFRREPAIHVVMMADEHPAGLGCPLADAAPTGVFGEEFSAMNADLRPDLLGERSRSQNNQ